MERGKPTPEDLFLLYPANRNYIEGTSRRIVGSNPIWRLISVLSVLFIVGLFIQGPLAGGLDLDTTLKVIAIAALPMLIALPFEIRIQLRNQRLAQTGQLIYGTVVSSKPSWLTSKYGMELEYTFTTPDGRQCTGKEIAIDIPFSLTHPSFAWPAVGTPVAVLYADKTFRVL
jgi:hypothetical protein